MKKRIVMRDEDDNVLYPATRSDNVICGGLSLSEKFGDDFFIMKDGNTYKKVTLSNGVFVFETVSVPSSEKDPYDYYDHVLCLGNSITIHGITEYWWGEWGMAATKREKDWVHVLESKLQDYNSSCKCYAVNLVSFERGTETDLATLVENASTKDGDVDNVPLSNFGLVIIRLGENVTDNSTFGTRLSSLIDSIRHYCPKANIVITGMFWKNDTKEGIIQSVAAQKDIAFLAIDQYDSAAYKQTMGGSVYGDDEQWHTINNSGVASHPNDAGMDGIANEIFNYLNH